MKHELTKVAFEVFRIIIILPFRVLCLMLSILFVKCLKILPVSMNTPF